MVLKQAGCVGFVFPREFFVSGVTCSARAPSVALVTSPGKLSSAIVEFVAPLRLWHSLRPINGWFSRRESSGPARALEGAASRSFRDVQAMFKRVRAPEEESVGASLERRFKQSVFWTSLKAAGPIRASVRGGAPPVRLVLQSIFLCEER